MSSTLPQLPTICLLTTGGTIAGLARLDGPYQAAALSGTDLVTRLNLGARCKLAVLPLAQIDSKDANPALWTALAQALEAAQADTSIGGVVITHGTDTLEETAFALSLCGRPNKPVVLTAAMRPADAVESDGAQNLRDAIRLVEDAIRTPGESKKGLWVVMAGQIFPAARVSKRHTERREAISATQVAGRIHGDAIEWLTPSPDAHHLPTWPTPPATDWPQVEIVPCYAGVSTVLLRSVLEAGVAGIVLAGTGQGTLPQSFLPFLAQAQRQGVVVVRSTRVPAGGVAYRTGMDDAQLGTLAARGLSPWKARILLQTVLFAQQVAQIAPPDRAKIQEAFDCYWDFS